MKELCSSGVHYPLAMGDQRRRAILRQFWDCLHFVTQKAAEKKGTCPPVWDPLFRGEPCSHTGHETKPGGTGNYHKPSGQYVPMGWFHPMRCLQPAHLLGHKGHGHGKYSCMQLYTAQCSELQTAATPSLCWSPPAVLHCWGNFGLTSIHPKLTSVPKRWSCPA